LLILGLPIALAIVFLQSPSWWLQPISGLARFFRSNLTRGQTIVIPVQFLGVVYQTPNESLPWYNTLVWTLLVTPVGFLLLGFTGVVKSIRRLRAEPLGLLILGNWGFLMALRAMPHTPGHDGVRLFLPAFGVLSLLIGMGTREFLERCGSWAWVAISAAVCEAVVSIALFFPVPLSYFSPLVGGLPGAARLGMEPTYYWDGLGSEALQWLRDHTHAAETIRFASFPTSLLYLRQTGELPARLSPIDRGIPTWYVVQHRPGAWSETDRRLVQRSAPEFNIGKFDVPLVWVFSQAEFDNAAVQVGTEPADERR
jgi:hypothetical protein